MSLGCLYCSGNVSLAGSCLMGRPNCLVFPSHLFCPSSLTERTWRVEKALANLHLAAHRRQPRGLQGMGTPTHVLQQRLLPHGLHQALGVHVAQAQDVQGAAVCAKRGGRSVGNAGNRAGQSRDETSPCSEKEGQAVASSFTNSLPIPTRG